MSVLSEKTLATLPADVIRPAYDRAKLKKGVVHFGPGAFHRAHQAQALDDLLAADPRWGIVCVSLHSAGVRDALAAQDGLYTLALLDEKISFRIIGAILEILVAPHDPEAVFARLTAPECEIVTLTITEKGYCLGANGKLDLQHADIRADIASPQRPHTAMGYLAEAAKRRRDAGVKPFVVICCDNLVSNGHKLGKAVIDLAGETDPKLANHIAEYVEFPGTMVDSITPATDDALRARVEGVLGMRDTWPIQREAFTQWVMQRHEHPGGPDWGAAGVTLTDDVSAFERAKLRILNASHSSLAYLGSLKGHETVADAMADPELAGFVRDLMEKDVSPSLAGPADFDLPAYREAVLKRFRNPAMRHLLSQVAWDGSQKLPNRLFGLIEEALAAGRPVERPARTIAAWLLFLRDKALAGEKLTDPLAPLLLETASRCTGDPEADVDRFLSLGTVFPKALAKAPKFRSALVSGYAALLNRTDSF